MKYFELRTTVYLKEDIIMKDVGNTIAKHINYCMSKSESLKDLHAKKLPKLYCFDYLYPFEEDRVYRQNHVYVFRMRTPKENIAREMRKVLSFYESKAIKPLGCDLRIKRFKGVEELYTITPTITTIDNKNWIVGNDFDLLWKRIDNNLEKKYQLFFGEKLHIKGSAIEILEIKNKKPIVMNYKDGKVLGNKFSIIFKPDAVAQKLAYMAVACGLLEKNSSVGAGFCKIGKRG
ncbi:CRISPR-associated endoribonuclease Cas6 [Crassaminicella indica]|uniref:CRISPR-associated endoribonuclease Cas6 n=1 Tax=Crassaminicella indica TaxID=2855394 RepID=A0ABX8RBT7_9CLOT|nr:CRISPR-associated endoribonuclease Cas6 [Crassaminicella indica]QXM05375.1 CRISPR-associated endoribonuclease Cas6 [Crassaminicella indica]